MFPLGGAGSSQDFYIVACEKGRDKADYRNEFLSKVAESNSLARVRLATQQDRYKRAYDAHVRATTRNLSVGDWAYVRTYAAPRELFKKLIFPAEGPFVVTGVGTDRRTFKVRTSEKEVTVSTDRVRKCPWPPGLTRRHALRQ